MSLNSKTNIKIIDAIGEGPIGGLVHHRKGVLLNDTAVTFEQLSGEDKTVAIRIREGAKDQSLFGEKRGFEAFESFGNAITQVEPVGREIGSSYSETLNDENLVADTDYGAGQVIVEVSDTTVDFVKLLFTVTKLYCVAPEGLARGQLFAAKIKLSIDIQDQTGGYSTRKLSLGADQKNVIEGIATSPYQVQTEEIDLRGFVLPCQIRVRKITFKNPENAFEIKRDSLRDLPKKTPLQDKRADEIIWTSMTLGKRVKVSYPNTALAFLSIDSEDYGTLPSRSYEVKGLKVRVPSNATVRGDKKHAPGSLKFDDSIPFNGKLKKGKEWTTCPICCFYDLLTNKRYGCGDFINPSNLNWVDLIELSKYCNELVDTEETDAEGNPVKEARFAINTVIASQAEAYNVLQDMASVFRGMLFWKADNVQVAGDHGELKEGDVQAIHVYSNSNVVNGSFVYSGSSLKTRSTRVRVRYNDPDNLYKSNFIIIEDKELIEKYGIQEKSVVAFGCTSKYQAQRMARWIMQSEKLHDETISFSVGLEGLNVLPGQVFEVSDEMRLGVRLAGRIVAAQMKIVSGTPFVKIDQTPVLPSVSGNNLTVVLADGTVETQGISSIDTSNNRVYLSAPFTQDPPDNALYAIRSEAAKLVKYRCLSVVEGEAGIYSVTGVKHQDGIYRAVEDPNDAVQLAPPFFYGNKPERPSDLKISFEPIDDSTNAKLRATISWTRGTTAPVASFQVKYKIGSANWIDVTTANNSIDIDSNLTVGSILYAKVRAIGLEPDKKKSNFREAKKEIPSVNTSELGNLASGTTAPVIVLPPDPEDVSIEVMGDDQVVLRWAAEADGQKLNNFIAHIRHSSKTDGTGTWPHSVLIRRVEARTTSAVLPLMNGEYLIKFLNEQKQRSKNAASAIVNVPDPLPRYNFEVVREDASPGEFPGQKANVFYSSEYDGLIFDGDALFDAEIADLDEHGADDPKPVTSIEAGNTYKILSIGSTDFTAIGADANTVGTLFVATAAGTGTGTVYGRELDTIFGTQFTSGEYIFQKVIDLGAVYSVRLSRILATRALYLNDLIDDRVALIETWTDFDGDTPDDTNVELYFRKSNSGISYSDNVQENGDKIQFEDGGNVKQESDVLFEEWVPLENNAYVGRSFQFKAVLTTDNPDETPIVDQLGVSVRFVRRTENSTTLQSGTSASGYPVTFENAFYTDGDTKVTVGITAFDLAAGDYYVLSEPTATGFTILFKSSDGRVLNKDFQYTAVGYGTQQT